MKTDFSQPIRQSNAAVILIIWKLYKTWFKRLLPIVLGIMASLGNGRLFLYAFIGILFLGAIWGILSFLNYTFFLSEKELHIKKGVLKKQSIVIPFERIQSINFKEGIIHQLFEVAELEIDTAGSSKTEFELYALSTNVANDLRQAILAHHAIPIIEDVDAEVKIEEVQDKTIFKLSILDLIKVGLTQNHFRSALIPIGLYYWLRDNLESAQIDIDSVTEGYAPEQLISLSISILLGIIAAYAILSILISIVTSFIRFYGLEFKRHKDGFSIKYGLVTKRQITMKDTKVQVFHWHDNLLRKIPNIFNLQIKQAASNAVKRKQSSINLAGVSPHHIQIALDDYFAERPHNVDKFIPISKWYFLRRAMILSMLFLILLALSFYTEGPSIYFFLAWIPIFLLNSYLEQKKKGIGLNAEVIHIKGGRYGQNHSLIQTYKIQGVSLSQSPFQRRKKLNSLTIYTAAGNLSIPYLEQEVGIKIRDFILYKVETDNRDWM